MRRSPLVPLVTLAVLALPACTDTPTVPQVEEDVAIPAVTTADPTGGPIFTPATYGWIFCFDGAWSPPMGGTDPFTFSATWGNVVTIVPDGFLLGVSPPPDFERTIPGKSYFAKWGFEGDIRVRYDGEAYEGFGRGSWILELPFAAAVTRVEVSVVGEVQDGEGNSYHLVCKDIQRDVTMLVHSIKLTPKG